MAGRGTDIQLGGNPDMRICQELADIPRAPSATRRCRHPGRGAELKKQARRRRPLRRRHERHESRRIDNQPAAAPAARATPAIALLPVAQTT